MKRAGILLLTFVLAGVLSAPAQATPPAQAKAVGQSPEEVVAYWTAKRMREAKPVERAQGSGKGAKTAYPFTRYEAPSPYNPAHGKVFFTDSGVNYVCSGTAIESGNKSVVWTAGHCVNEGPGAYFTNWAFVPAYKDGARPYGTWAARTLLTTAPWRTSGDFSYDEGAAVVSPVAGKSLTDTVGSRGIAFDQSATQHYFSHGYPAASPFSGGRLFICEADLGLRDNSANPPTMGIGCDMTGGSSGGGWVVGNKVLSVNSYHYGNLRNVMFGPYQGTVAQQLYTSASGA
jgi:V8-like Glu-specific endopeptidase